MPNAILRSHLGSIRVVRSTHGLLADFLSRPSVYILGHCCLLRLSAATAPLAHPLALKVARWVRFGCGVLTAVGTRCVVCAFFGNDVPVGIQRHLTSS